MPSTKIIITDVTRMQVPRVCIAGITEEGQTIRPIFPHGNIEEDWLYENGQAIIRPFATINFNIIEHRPKPPHCEDWVIHPEYRIFSGILIEEEKRIFLEKYADPSVNKIFGAEIQVRPGHFIRENEGCRSLGTIQTQIVTHLIMRDREGKLEYRIEFIDENGDLYELPITDLSFRYFVESELRKQVSHNRISSNLIQQFHHSEVFLRIGLTRPTWKEHPHCCFLQVNGIYTFPDYLNGRCFADFINKES